MISKICSREYSIIITSKSGITPNLTTVHNVQLSKTIEIRALIYVIDTIY